jgi:hypothetical protein
MVRKATVLVPWFGRCVPGMSSGLLEVAKKSSFEMTGASFASLRLLFARIGKS